MMNGFTRCKGPSNRLRHDLAVLVDAAIADGVGALRVIPVHVAIGCLAPQPPIFAPVEFSTVDIAVLGKAAIVHGAKPPTYHRPFAAFHLAVFRADLGSEVTSPERVAMTLKPAKMLVAKPMPFVLFIAPIGRALL